MANRVVVIGAVAAGTKAAARARRMDPCASIRVLTEETDVSYAGCGLPYYVGDVIKERGELVVRDAASFRAAEKIEIVTRARATAIDRGRRRVTAIDLDTGREFEVEYDALIIATGAKPVIPDIPGIHLDGVFSLRNVADADALKSFIETQEPRSAAVVGGGFIGLETAENLSSRGMQVTLIEMMEQFPPGFDADMSGLIRNCLQENGVRVRAGEKVEAIEGSSGRVRSVRTTAGNAVADLVVVAIGIRPETGLAREAGLAVGRNGAILVDDHMRTTDPSIYAVGDCASTTNLVTGDPAWFPLG
ncbi:MAG: FAD/NAD(P)-binding oxidoreductase, partial [Bacillota bacterium]